MNWLKTILSVGLIPLVKYFTERHDRRQAEREHLERARERLAERRRLRAQTAQRIKEAKENFDDIDPSKIEVNP